MIKLLKACLVCLLVVIFVCGIAAIIISNYPFNEVKTFVEIFVPDGDYGSFSVKHVHLIRFAGILVCVIIPPFFVLRRRLLRQISDIFSLILYYINNMKEALKKEDKIHFIAFMLIMLLAIAVRIFYLNQPLGSDESRIFIKFVYHVSNGVKGVFSLLSKYDDHGNHIFHTLLVYLTYMFLGSEQWLWIIRLPAFFAGILLVPASYMLVRIFHNKNAALLACGVVASSHPLIYYSVNARGYTMICVIFLLILSLGAYIKNNSGLAGWHLFAILSAFGFYTTASMVYPYGIVMTWLFLSILFKDTNQKRCLLFKNLFISIAMTVFLTLLLYSPVIFFGSGFESVMGDEYYLTEHAFDVSKTSFISKNIFSQAFYSWNISIPVMFQFLLIVGFICSIFFYKKLNVHRIPVILAGMLGLLTIFIVQGVACYYRRCWLFLLPFYIGLASSGIIYLFKPIEYVFRRHKTAVFALLAISVSLILTGNLVHSVQYINTNSREVQQQMNNVDDSGRYIEFRYIKVVLKTQIRAHRRNVKTLTLFPSQSINDFWRTRLQDYFSMMYNYALDETSETWVKTNTWTDEYIISDLNTYLSKDSRKCHTLFIISSESIDIQKVLLEKKGIAISDYSMPQLMHRFKYANLYKMHRTRNCSKNHLTNQK